VCKDSSRHYIKSQHFVQRIWLIPYNFCKWNQELLFSKNLEIIFFISYIYCMLISLIAHLLFKWSDYWISCQGSQTLAPKSATVHSKAIIYVYSKVIKPSVIFLSSKYHCIRCFFRAHVQIFIFQSTLSIVLTTFLFVMRFLRLKYGYCLPKSSPGSISIHRNGWSSWFIVMNYYYKISSPSFQSCTNKDICPLTLQKWPECTDLIYWYYKFMIPPTWAVVGI
jgi:hypothetical protein